MVPAISPRSRQPDNDWRRRAPGARLGRSRTRRFRMQPKAAAARRVRVILADDHELLRSGVHALLDTVPGVEVIAEAGDGAELIQLAEGLEPDIVFTDIHMPVKDGIEALQHLRKTRPKVRCV